jgi:hypothetical protein
VAVLPDGDSDEEDEGGKRHEGRRGSEEMKDESEAMEATESRGDGGRRGSEEMKDESEAMEPTESREDDTTERGAAPRDGGGGAMEGVESSAGRVAV